MPDRVRVAHVLTRFSTGGSERRLAQLLSALRGSSFDHHLIVGRDSRIELAQQALGSGPVTVEPHLVREPHPYHDALALTKLVRLLHANAFDVVHTCQSKAGIIGRLAARLAGAPVILHSLTMANFGDGFGSAASLVYKNAERLVGRWTDAYMVVGSDLRQRFVSAGVARSERYHIIRSAIALEAFADAAARGSPAARSALGLNTRVPLLAYVGSLDDRKGVRQLPDYVAAVQARARSRVELLVAGEGPLRSELEVRFADAGLADCVRFYGFTDRVAELLAATDCLVLLSRAEGLPQVLVQAAAARTAFVCYAVDGARELLARGATGHIVSAGDVAAAADATAMLLSGPRPPEIDLAEWQHPYVEQQYRELFDRLASPLSSRFPADRTSGPSRTAVH